MTGYGDIPTRTIASSTVSTTQEVQPYPTLYPLYPPSSTRTSRSLIGTPLSVTSGSLSSSSASTSSPNPSPSPSPAPSSAYKIGLGLGLGLGIPLLLMTAGILFFLWRRHNRARAAPMPDYSASDAVPNSPIEKKTVFGSAAESEGIGGAGDRNGKPELHGEHIAPYLREMPGTPGSHRSELPS